MSLKVVCIFNNNLIHEAESPMLSSVDNDSVPLQTPETL